MFKVGDRVRYVNFGRHGGIEARIGSIVEIIEVIGDGEFITRFDDGTVYSTHISEIESLKLTDKSMNIKEKFVLALTKEPQKSFRKAGITNGDDLLTDEGQKIFLSWLLHTKHAEDFKKEVVDDLLKEEKE